MSGGSRKYSLNENFFSSWSPEMAYVLGFWYADGYMRQDKSYRVIFNTADRDNLTQIKKVMRAQHPIADRWDKTRDSHTWDLHLYSRQLYEDLKKLGGMRRKSLVMIFPDVPNEFLPDFIRGYFDGDGSVHFATYRRTKDGRLAKELRTSFTSGSYDFLNSLMRILHDEIDLPIKKIVQYDNGRSFKVTYGMRDSDALLKYMYYDGFSIGLQRKAEFVDQIPDYQVHRRRKKAEVV